MSIIALLTDFGLKDGFVGSMKGVILSINPEAKIVDISHEIESFSIIEGSIVLNATYRYFPKGTIFVSVVDPGVGTERKFIIVKTKDYFFVCPDNGLLTLVLKKEKIKKIIEIKNKEFFLESDTNTFHGRDIFAPIAAYLSKGIKPEKFGDGIKNIKTNDIFEPKVLDGRIIGKIIKFDKFGNAITNIGKLPERFEIIYKDYRITKVCRNFLEGEKDKPNLIKGSFGFYELFLIMDSFKDRFNARVFEEFRILSK